MLKKPQKWKFVRDLLTLVENGQLVLLLPDVVRDEVDLEATADACIKKYRTSLSFPCDSSAHEQESLVQRFADRVEECCRRIQAAWRDAVVISRGPFTLEAAYVRMSQRKAPARGKGSYSDGLIVEELLEFAQGRQDGRAIFFVTTNKRDFEHNEGLDPALGAEFLAAGVQYSRWVGEAIQAARSVPPVEDPADDWEDHRRPWECIRCASPTAIHLIWCTACGAEVQGFLGSEDYQIVGETADGLIIEAVILDHWREEELVPVRCEECDCETMDVQFESVCSYCEHVISKA